MKDEAQANPVFDQLLVGDELHVAWPQRRIICGTSQRRQRALLAAVVTLLPLVLGTACQARSTVEAAQTAVIAAQTVLPGAQATVQAGATLVGSALGNAQPAIATLQTILQGAAVNIQVTPEGAAPDAVTQVDVSATDVEGRLGQVDASVRRAAASAALNAAEQYYPSATINLQVLNADGSTLLSGSVAPGQQPRLQ